MRTLVLLSMVACAGKDWRAAVTADTSQAYSAYVAHHRGEPKAAVAARRAEDRAWTEAVSANTSVAYGSYVSAFPQGEHSAEARVKGEELAWTEAHAAGTLAALSAYVARYPGSPHAADGEQLIEKLWYDDAKREGTEASWGRYVVRYPEGAWVEEAKQERERLAWEQAVAIGSRDLYIAFIQRYPDAARAEDAKQFLAASRVTTIQPVVVLGSTWQADRQRATVLARVRGELERGLLTDLKREFTVLPAKTVDPNGEPVPHPHEAWGAKPGVGLLVIRYDEAVGRTFEPSGHATDNAAKIELYAPNTRLPVFSRTVEASTPERIRGQDASVLHTSAIRELGALLRAYGPELETHRPLTDQGLRAPSSNPAGGVRPSSK